MIILDLMLPKLDGLKVCKHTREIDKQLPIAVLTSKSEELDKVLGLELGTDDCITKPFSVRELTARIKALLRRAGGAVDASDEDTPKQLDFGHLSIDLKNRKVLGSGDRIYLTAKEFEPLAFHPGKTYSRDELLDLIWGV